MHALHPVEPPKTDSLYYGNLHNVEKWLWSRIIPYSLLYIATSIITETSLLRVMDNEVMSQWTKINANFPPKMDSLDLLAQNS